MAGCYVVCGVLYWLKPLKRKALLYDITKIKHVIDVMICDGSNLTFSKCHLEDREA
jgi:hypothetical protein